MMASDVQRSKHALPSDQHPAPMTISSTEARYGITEPLYVIDNGLLLNFDESSG